MSEINKIRNIKKDELISLISKCNSKQDVLRLLEINIKNTQVLKYLSKFIDENNIDISHHSMGRPLHLRYTYEDVKTLVDKNICWTDLMKDMGIRFVGNNIKTVKKLIDHYKLDTSHFDHKKAAVKNHSKTFSMEEVFCENSNVSRPSVKTRLIELKLIPYKCENCPLVDEWNGHPLVLHLEHKNGINNDNRLENLCFLCPNCHSQTASYAGRNVLGSKRTKDGSFVNAS